MIRIVLLALLIMECSPLYVNNIDKLEIVESIDANYIPELETKKTIMNFAGEDDLDGLFFNRVISVENYKNGKKHGIWIYYNEDGKIDKIENYSNGELIK